MEIFDDIDKELETNQSDVTVESANAAELDEAVETFDADEIYDNIDMDEHDVLTSVPVLEYHPVESALLPPVIDYPARQPRRRFDQTRLGQEFRRFVDALVVLGVLLISFGSLAFFAFMAYDFAAVVGNREDFGAIIPLSIFGSTVLLWMYMVANWVNRRPKARRQKSHRALGRR